jgi:hypothetical protein
VKVDESPWAADRQSALEVLEILVFQRRNARRWRWEGRRIRGYERFQSDQPITLPQEVARMIRECAVSAEKPDAIAILDEAFAKSDDGTITLSLENGDEVCRDIRSAWKAKANKRGIHKGLGRKQPRHSRGQRLETEAIAAFTKRRKVDLHGEGKGKFRRKTDAEGQALIEGEELADKRYDRRLSADYIKKIKITLTSR